MVELWTHREVARFMEEFGPRTASEVVDWLPGAIAAHEDEPLYGGWALARLDTGEVVGWIGFGPDRRQHVGDIDFAYIIASTQRGNGFASEALAAVVEYCFGELGVSSVWGECHPDNSASARVMEKAGLVFIGEVDGQHRYRLAWGERPARANARA